ncbi:MAG: hypothetical protein K2P45_02630, partial [Eubacterium sp.]|nr:hypothetical protein [Eubacterium sp.]
MQVNYDAYSYSTEVNLNNRKSAAANRNVRKNDDNDLSYKQVESEYTNYTKEALVKDTVQEQTSS